MLRSYEFLMGDLQGMLVHPLVWPPNRQQCVVFLAGAAAEKEKDRRTGPSGGADRFSA
jgi:hypothetical protein